MWGEFYENVKHRAKENVKESSKNTEAKSKKSKIQMVLSIGAFITVMT